MDKVWLTAEENAVKYFFYFSPQTPTLQQHHSYSFYIKKRIVDNMSICGLWIFKSNLILNRGNK